MPPKRASTLEAPTMTQAAIRKLVANSVTAALGAQVMRYFAFGWHLDDLHVTWAHLEKKRTRLQANTKTLEDLCSQSLETASQGIHDAVTAHIVTVSHHFTTASARTDSTRI
ncbi:hypothetical protein Tco_1239956 [Tanacetum coccineum]